MLVVAELKKRAIAPSSEKRNGKCVAPTAAVDSDEADIFVDAPTATVPVVRESKTGGSGLRNFVDVLAELGHGTE
jgi:hypothetical protein